MLVPHRGSSSQSNNPPRVAEKMRLAPRILRIEAPKERGASPCTDCYWNLRDTRLLELHALYPEGQAAVMGIPGHMRLFESGAQPGGFCLQQQTCVSPSPKMPCPRSHSLEGGKTANRLFPVRVTVSFTGREQSVSWCPPRAAWGSLGHQGRQLL